VRKILITMWFAALLSLVSGLSLEEAKQLALKHNPAYLAQKQATEAAQWSSQQALGNLLPSLTAGATYLYLDPAPSYQSGQNTYTLNHDSRSLELSLYQPLFLGGKLWQSYKISKISAGMAKLNLENARLTVSREVETKYYNVLQLKELLAIAEKDLQSTRQSLETAEVRFGAGTLSGADRNKIRSRLAAKEVSLIQAQTALELAWQDMKNSLALDDSHSYEELQELPGESLSARLAELSLEASRNFTQKAVELARQNNYELRTASAAVDLSQKAYNIARGNFLPTIGLALSRSFAENGMDRYEFEGSNTLALTASVPLLPFWNNYSGSRKAYHELQKTRLDYNAAEDGILLSVKAAALNLISGARQVNAAQIAYRTTQDTYLQMRERYVNNLLSATDMLDIEIMLAASMTSLNNARFSFLKAKSSLLQALGTDDENVLSELFMN